mmetsp:Transcript_82617/g.230384  ORF Transcript_82617/g.230384 Transcript_82617/m.230384 type:complete len:824 (+) Transcript_82617:166-2637(+)
MGSRLGGWIRLLFFTVIGLAKLALVYYFCLRAYRIRILPVRTYGYIIHELDPWFNYRATEYLAAHGSEKFFKWYDYMSWYPIGRPVGTTIYPGMQFTSVAIYRAMQYVPNTKVKYPAALLSIVPKWFLPNMGRPLKFAPMSVNDVCVMVPAWFGSLATFFTYLLSVELSGSSGAGVVSAFVMAIIPAHLMRSYAGEFDNEAVAMTTFCATLWLWARSIRTKRSWPIGILAGIAYFYAAATWGGYIFINNLVGLHAACLVGLGKYNSGVHRAYSLYWIVGTIGAMQVPVIGNAPVRALEQMPSLLVFCGYQVLEFCDVYRRRFSKDMTPFQFFRFRVALFMAIGVAIASIAYIMMERGIFIPLGARIRGLFLETIKTGNPLVDSVSEHQPASKQAYEHYLGDARYLAVVGVFFCWHQQTPSKYLTFLYAAVAYHYSLKMVRLILICAPIVSVLAGFPVGIIGEWCVEQVIGVVCKASPAREEIPLDRTGGMGSTLRTCWRVLSPVLYPRELRDALAMKDGFSTHYPWVDRPVRLSAALVIIAVACSTFKTPVDKFIRYCDGNAESLNNPMIVFEAKLNDGREVRVEDYFRGYRWLRDNTPADSRVMAWWDYGYHITGIGERTSIADGNTWNHEHIATLGRILTSSEKRSHNAMRHLADYALVWAGGRGDDIGKSPHLARIGNSVFPDHCGDEDPLCHKFSFYADNSPMRMMAESFLYKAVYHDKKPGVKLNKKFWKHVHTTEYGLMRIYKVMNVSQESKTWVADPANRVCDAPGSWYCVGQYPPALDKLIAMRRNFAQLEDFNKKGAAKSAYTKHIEKESKREL